MNLNSGELAASISLAGVSTIACIIAVEGLLYYKMWRTFIYRLVLYMFMFLIVFNSTTIIFFSIELLFESTTTNSIGFNVTEFIFFNGCLTNVSMLMTCITVCIYLMALHNYQFTYKSDLCLLISSVVYLTAVVTLTIINYGNVNNSGGMSIAYDTLVYITIPINIVFTALTLVPLCCRACGYNLCMKTAATIESHRKALREILPFFILTLPSFFVTILQLVPLFNYDGILVSDVILLTLGLFSSLLFAVHLFFIRKNLGRLRGNKGALKTTNYGSVYQLRTHRTAVFTSEGISESCNTEHLPVSEDEVDSRFLLQKNNLMQC